MFAGAVGGFESKYKSLLIAVSSYVELIRVEKDLPSNPTLHDKDFLNNFLTIIR